MREFACDGPINVDITAAAGLVDVLAEERSSVVVDVTPGSPGDASRVAAAQTVVEMNADLLLIETPPVRGFVLRRSPSVNIRVRVPADSRLRFRGSSADVQCGGRLGDVDISGSSGDARLDHVGGDLRRKTSSGDTLFNRVDGDLSVGGASGDVRGGSVGGGLTSRTASGDVRIGAVAGSVKVQSASGDIEIDNLAQGVARINTTSGDVEVGVAEGASVWLDLYTMSGGTRSDLPISDSAPTGGVAALNLSVRTTSGDIKVRRSRVAAVRVEAPSVPAT
jgi:DUF4097 and DUF4098 domain-containing protein YvlB